MYTDTCTRTRKPRLTVELTEEQYAKLRKHIEHGMQRKLFSIVVDDIIQMMERYGEMFILALLHHKITYRKLVEEYVARNGIDDGEVR